MAVTPGLIEADAEPAYMVPEVRGRKVHESVSSSLNQQDSRARLGPFTDVELTQFPQMWCIYPGN